MTTQFFHAKRPWSKYKDFILGYYLQPYIPKVARLGKPVLIVDCFAGCGSFGDGEPGSPLIICDTIQRWREKGMAVSGEFIEADVENFRSLTAALEPYDDFAKARFGRFEDHIEEMARRARTETVFLYIDPYTVKGLVFDQMKAVYDQIRNAKASVEVLMNFNVATFMRWALAALKRVEDLPGDEINDEADYQADDPNDRIEIATLNGIAGGDYWQSIARDAALPFDQKLQDFTNAYVRELQGSFDFVCTYPVKSRYEHVTPKYMLVYGTRHPNGLELMNDAMCQARERFLGAQFQKGRLFDMRPAEEIPDLDRLKSELLRVVEAAGPIRRSQLRARALKSLFGRFSCSELDKAVGDLLKSGKLYSITGKTRINDSVTLSTKPFLSP